MGPGSLQQIIYLFSCTVLLSMTLVVGLRYQPVRKPAKLFLVGYFGSYFLAAAITYIVLTPALLVRLPHVSRWAMFFFLLILPFSFLHVRTLMKNVQPGWKDLLVFVPAFIYLCDYLPFFLKSGSEKLAIMQSLGAVDIRSGYQEGWLLPPLTWGWLRYLAILACWIAQGMLIYRYFNRSRLSVVSGSSQERKWFLCLQGTQLFIFLPSLLLYLLDRRDLVVLFANMGALVVASVQGYFLLLHPALLYGRGEPSDNPGQAPAHPSELFASAPDDRGTTEEEDLMPVYAGLMDDATLDGIERQVEEYFGRRQPYLNPDFRIADLAMDLGIPSHKLSAFFSRRCHMGFKDYVNRLRVENSIRKLQSGEHQAKTLEAISLESGFQSRSTFIRAFKKYKGVTPSEFLEK